MSLHRMIVEAKLKGLYGEGKEREVVLPEVCWLQHRVETQELVIEEINGVQHSFRNITRISSESYLDGVMVSSRIHKKPKKHKPEARLTISTDCPERYFYVVVKGDTAYLFYGPSCKENPEFCRV